MSDYRWGARTSARPNLLAAFSAEGVTRVEYVSAFPDQDAFAVWLGTATDDQADLLRGVPDIVDRVRAVLRETGFTDHDLETLLVVAQSQETVDRDFAGSWFYALR